jgi:Family of unknown function (DUF5681)
VTYRIGYKKPPRETRFKPGESGNPGGKPKESKNRTTLLLAELDTKVAISEGGRPRKATKLALIIKRVVNAAVRGDFKAFPALVKLLELTGTNLWTPTPTPKKSSLLPEDLTKLSTQELSDLYMKLVRRSGEDDG